MAIGKASDFKVYQEYFQTGIVETLTQNSNAFNAASRGAIRLSTASLRGDYAYRAFFETISGLASRRDTTSVSTATDLAITQDEFISVKLSRKLGPVAQTMDAFAKAMGNRSAEEMNILLGNQVAKAMQVEMLNSTLTAGVAALNNQSDVKYTIAASGTMTTAGLVSGLAKFGDAADRIVCWVMHSKVYYDLVAAQISANIDGVSNFNVATGTPVTLNRPVLISDSASLTGGSPTNYYTLGLTADALQVENSEEERMIVEPVTGLENLVVRMQGEYAYNLGVKGFKWDVSNGGANPADAALATGSNWDVASTSYKDFGGVIIQST
jgi:hypothetical protein